MRNFKILAIIALTMPSIVFAGGLKSELEGNLRDLLEDQGSTLHSIEVAYFNKAAGEGNIADITKNSDFALANIKADSASGKFSADVMTEGKDPVNIAGRFHELVEVPVLRQDISAGDIISEADIEYKNIAKRTLRKNHISDESELIGMEAKRKISANKPVNNRSLTKPVLVKKGGLINMIYQTKYIELKTLGQALEDGADGQIIRLRNQDSNTIVMGKVDASGSVKINYTQQLGKTSSSSNRDAG